MKRILREYWPWFAIPLVLVALGIGALLYFVHGEEGTAPFVYNLG